MRRRKIKLSHKAIGYPIILAVTVLLGYIVIQPLLAEVHYQRAKEEYNSIKWEKAIFEYQKAISIQPGSTYYRLELARIYSKLSHLRQDKEVLEKAIQEFRTALELNPHDGMAYSQLGWTFRQHGMYEEAAGELKMAIELDPTNVSFHWRLGSVYKARGELSKAKEEFQKVLDVIPYHGQAQRALAQVNEELKQL